MRAFELRKQIAAKKAQAKALVDGAEMENRDMSADERTQFDAVLADVEGLKNRVAALEQVESTEDQVSDEPPARKSTPIGLETRAKDPVHSDLHRYSLLRAINRQVNGLPIDGVEKEVNDELARRNGKPAPEGFYMPASLSVRALTTVTGAGAIPTILDTTFIEALRNRLVMAQAGVTVLTGMVGNFAIPRQSATSTAYWIGTEGQCPPPSNTALDQVTFTPHTCGAFTDITRRFLLQASTDAEQFVRNDLVRTVALAIDQACLSGTGGADPLGIFNDPAIPAVSSGANGGAPTWGTVVGMETQVAESNGLQGELAYITNARVMGALKTTPKIGTTMPIFLWDNGSLNGYDAYVTNSVSGAYTKGTGTNLSGIAFGDWSSAVLAVWGSDGGVSVTVDPYTGSCSGTVRIVALQDVDFHVRQPLSFSKAVDVAA